MNIGALARRHLIRLLRRLELDPTPTSPGDVADIAYRRGWNDALVNVRRGIG